MSGRTCFAVLVVGLLTVWGGLSPAPALGRGGVAAVQDAAAPEIDQQALTARIAELAAAEESGQLDASSARELELLRETQALLSREAAARAEAARFAEEARTAPEVLAQIQAYMAKPAEELLTPVEAGVSVEELNTRIQAARARLQTEKDLRAKVDSDETFRTTRREQIPQERAKATERLEAVRAELAAGAAPDDPPQLARAKRWRALAEQRFQTQQMATLDEELRSYDSRRSLLQSRRSYRDRKIDIETRNAAVLEEALNQAQLRLAQQAQQEAARSRRAAANAHAVVRQVLETNQSITDRTAELLKLKAADAAAEIEAESRLAEWSAAYARSTARIERAGLTNAIGQHLRSQRARMPDIGGLDRRMSARDKRLGELVNEAEDCRVALSDLSDIDSVVDRRIADSTEPLPQKPEDLQELRTAAREALTQQRQYLNTLVSTYNDYLDTTLLDLQNTERELAKLLRRYRAFIDERVLWIRSAEPVRWRDVRDAWSAAVGFVDPGLWGALLSRLRADVIARVFLYVPGVALLAALAGVRGRMRRRLEHIAERTRRLSTDRFVLTISAIVLTVAMAAVWPCVVASVGWRVQAAAGDTRIGAALGAGLVRAAGLLLLGLLIWHLCRPGGLGDAHFGWRSSSLALVRRHLRWVLGVIVPLTFLVGAAADDESARNTIGRFAYIAGSVAVSVFVYFMAHPTTGIARWVIGQNRGGWLDRLRYVWLPAVVLVPVATGVLAAAGYFYTALSIRDSLVDSTWLVLVIVVGRAALLRALYLAQRKLAIEQLRKRREELARQTAEPGAGETPAPAPDEEAPLDVAAVSAQARQLLNTAVVVAAVIGMLVVWRTALPALGMLQQVHLWTPEASAAVAAPEVASSVEEATLPAETGGQAITLWHAVYAVLLLVITVVVSKNIPGLLEVTILQRLPISRSARYAWTTVARYALVIVGVIVAFNAIGIGWSKVQWLAAAITVGLGFGLQEIFANFVSGLIILFERPVRVGDTVTVGDIGGTVSRVRMRATTIMDWDRKEWIIPNKEFVTGQIINWTLSDPMLRVVIPVGIAYGSDTQLAEKLLLEVAEKEPMVLDDPPPGVVFQQFGASSLDFSLRVYIPSIENMLAVRHRLHNAIDRAFREAGIVIAFPQQDVHLHYEVPLPGGAAAPAQPGDG